MPRVPQVQTLKEICCTYVAGNIRYWCKDYVENCEDKKYIYIIGPFNDIPFLLVEEILQKLKKVRQMKTCYLPVLITPNLENVDLSHNRSDMNHALQIVGARCHKLRSLNISYVHKFSQRMVKQALTSLSSLTTLNLSGSSVTDSVLGTVGACCSVLRELDVTHCKKITDPGIMSLCVAMDIDRQPCDHYGQCRNSLRVLKMMGTNVSNEGVRCVLLNAPNLIILECVNSAHVLDIEHRNVWEEFGRPEEWVPNFPHFSLQHLHLTAVEDEVNIDVFAIAVALCPAVNSVAVENWHGLTLDILMPLIRLSSLEKLSLHGECVFMQEDTFLIGVAPVIMHHGSSLSHIQISGLPVLNMMTIASFCPNIKLLHLVDIGGFADANMVVPKEAFQELETILVFLEDTDLPVNQLQAMLSSPKLYSVYLRGVSALTDQLLEKMIQTCGFHQLKYFEIEECNEISGYSIKLLLTPENSIESIKMWRCRNVTKADYEFFKEMGRNNKWNLCVDWN